METIAYCVDRVAGRVPVIAGTGANDTQVARENALAAERLGVDGLLIVTPYYNLSLIHISAPASGPDGSGGGPVPQNSGEIAWGRRAAAIPALGPGMRPNPL